MKRLDVDRTATPVAKTPVPEVVVTDKGKSVGQDELDPTTQGPTNVVVPQGDVGVGRSRLVRAKQRGQVRGFRALKAATGLDGFIPLGQLNTLDEVRSIRRGLAERADDELVARFADLAPKLQAGTPLAAVRSEAIAIAAEMMLRTTGMDPRDEQLLVTIAMVGGNAAELATGEGKTLAMGMAAAVISLKGEGVHVLTANGYLAQRDATNLASFFDGIGVSTGVVTETMLGDYEGKRDAYAADVTYGDVNTVAFDWLEDQTWWNPDARVMRPLYMALVDEADHVMLDNAQKPLVLSRVPTSGDAEPNVGLMQTARSIVDQLDGENHVAVYIEGDYPRAHLTDAGVEAFEELVAAAIGLSDDDSIWEAEHTPLLREVYAAIDARFCVRRGHEYLKQDDEIVLIDPTTGRPNPAGRLRHGLHNAVRVREGLEPEQELETIGMGSFQHFFRAYAERGATTGTADGVKEELRDLYNLPLVRIPTHRKNLRVDLPDRQFVHPALRDGGAIADLIERHEKGQPVLLSCDSVRSSQRMAALVRDPILAIAGAVCSSAPMLAEAAGLVDGAQELLGRAAAHGTDERRLGLAASFADRMREDPAGMQAVVAALAEAGLDLTPLLRHPLGLRFQTLDAQHADNEAEVVAQSGHEGAIIISTQMAGRGSDIQVPDEVLELGGLHVIGVERKINARQDRQLVGRSGRCGEIGSSQFFVSPADAFLAYLPASDRRALARKLSSSPPELKTMAERRVFSRAVKGAQQRAERRAEGERRVNARLDESIEHQRVEVVSFRQKMLADAAPFETIAFWIQEWVEAQLPQSASSDQVRELLSIFDPNATILLDAERYSVEDVASLLTDFIRGRLADVHARRNDSPEAAKQYLRDMVLSHTDREWISLLRSQEHMRTTAAMRAKFDMFSEHVFDMAALFRDMTQTMRTSVIEQLAFHVQPAD